MRKLWRLAVGLILLVLLTGTVFADETSVTGLRTDCVLEPDGACTVTLTVELDFAPGTESFSIPISSAARDVTCSAAGYQLSSAAGCRLVQLSGTLSGATRIIVSYRVAETVTGTGNGQLLQLNLLYPGWVCPIKGYEVHVKLPGAFTAMPTFSSGYFGELIENYLEISIRDGVIDAHLNDKQVLRDHEAMSMTLELPADFFDLRFLAGKTVRTDRMLFLGFLALAALYWLVFLRNLPLLPKRQAMPPEGGNAGLVPYLLTERDPDRALMVVQWASLGYLTISRSRKGRIWLSRQIDMGNERKEFEGEVFRTLFSRGEQCDVRSAEFLKARRVAVEKGPQFWRSRVFSPKAGPTLVLRALALAAGFAICLACFDLWVASKSWRWFLILPLSLLGTLLCWAVQQLGGFLLRRHCFRTAFFAGLSAVLLLLFGRKAGLTGLMGLNLLAQLAIGLLLRCGGRRTKGGAALGSELLGYRRYLLSASSSRLRSNLEADPQFFYRVLPYADALQVGRIFASGFDRARLEDCDWLHWEGKPLHTALGFYARYRRLMAGLRGERDPDAPRRVKSRQPPVSTRMEMPASKRGEGPNAERTNRSVPRTGSASRRSNNARRSAGRTGDRR